MHAVDPAQVKANAMWLTAIQIVDRVKALPMSRWITLTGGDPAQQKIEHVISRLKAEGFKIAVETQGVFNPAWLQRCNVVTLSPKPPSSGMVTDYSKLSEIMTSLWPTPVKTALKVVVFDDRDFDYALDMHRRYPATDFYLSVGSPPPKHVDRTNEQYFNEHVISKYKWLCEKALLEPTFENVTIFPQLHALMWGHEKGR